MRAERIRRKYRSTCSSSSAQQLHMHACYAARCYLGRQRREAKKQKKGSDQRRPKVPCRSAEPLKDTRNSSMPFGVNTLWCGTNVTSFAVVGMQINNVLLETDCIWRTSWQSAALYTATHRSESSKVGV